MYIILLSNQNTVSCMNIDHKKKVSLVHSNAYWKYHFDRTKGFNLIQALYIEHSRPCALLLVYTVSHTVRMLNKKNPINEILDTKIKTLFRNKIISLLFFLIWENIEHFSIRNRKYFRYKDFCVTTLV